MSCIRRHLKMIPSTAPILWGELLGTIVHTYLLDSQTICVLWNQEFDFDLELALGDKQFLLLKHESNESSFFEAKRIDLDERGIFYNDFVLSLTIAIECNHCEAFVAFQNEIPCFVEAFVNASLFSDWNSLETHFVFAYYRSEEDFNYFQHEIFREQPGIIIIEADDYEFKTYQLKTNKFVGNIKTEQAKLLQIESFQDFKPQQLIMSKLNNLQAREIIVGTFNYRPFEVVDEKLEPQIVDHGVDNPRGTMFLDGTEIRILKTFCERYNCAMALDSSKPLGDWGLIYVNGTGEGLMGMLLAHRIDIVLAAFYPLGFKYVDMTTFLGRSGITCMVPAPTRLTSWDLPLRPFQFMLWLCVGMCLIVEIFGLFGIRSVDETLSHGTSARNWRENWRFGYSTTMKLFVSQGTTYNVNSSAVRVLLLACYIINIIMTSVYSGGLAAVLTLPILTETPDSIEGMLKFNLKWASQSDDWVLALTEGNDSQSIKLVSNYHSLSPSELQNSAESDYQGFIVERLEYGHFGNVEYLTPIALARLKLMVDDIYFQYTIGYVQRRWAYQKNFNEFIYWWHSAGLDKYWEYKIAADFMDGNQQGRIQTSMHLTFDGGPVKLDITNFAGLGIIWLMGIGLSICVFILELIVRKMN